MTKQTFILRDERVRANLMAEVARLKLDEPLEVTIKPYKRNRSLEQNSLYWAWCQTLSDETGHTADEIHEVMKQKFLPPVFVDVGGECVEVRRSSAKLKVGEMAEYMTRVHAWASDLGVLLPLPEDRWAA